MKLYPKTWIKLGKLFDEIENKTNFLDILKNTNSAKGVQIFIGSQNFFVQTLWSFYGNGPI